MTDLASIVFGESLIDEFPDRRVVAGAPLHVAIHFARAGWHSMLWSRVGADEDGARIRDLLIDYGVDTSLLQTDERVPTGTVEVEIPDEGEHSFTIRAPAAWDSIKPVSPPPPHDVFYYGSLVARDPLSAETLWQALATSRASHRIFDVNLRSPYDDFDIVKRGLDHATLVKMNADEFASIRLGLGSAENVSAMFDRYHQLDYVCVTRGADGAELFTRDRASQRIESAPIEPVDTVGAGDAFTAGLSVALVESEPVQQALHSADALARSILRVRGGLPQMRPTQPRDEVP